MTVYMVPGVFGVGGQILDSNGKPVSGGLVGTYAAGTTSPVVVFTTATGNVSAANPVVTSSDGRLPHELWQTGGQAIKITLTDSLSNTLGGPYDNLTGINDPTAFLTTTNTWTASQNFNVIRITSATITTLSVASLSVSTTITSLSIATGTISTLSVTSVTGGTVPLARMQRFEGSSKNSTTVTGPVQLCVVSLGSVNAGDRIFASGLVTVTRGGTDGFTEISMTESTGTASTVIGKDALTVVDDFFQQAATAYKKNISGIFQVTVSGTCTIELRCTYDGIGTAPTVVPNNGQLYCLVLNNG